MEKLIELLNEYEKKAVVHWYEWYWEDVLMCRYIKDNFEFYTDEATTIAISKYYWFIKWLVDNDKIDFESENYPLKKYYPYFNDDVLAIVSQDCNTYEDHCRVCYEEYESLLMLLAIQDEPIEFLISILK